MSNLTRVELPPFLTIISPVYNEEDGIAHFCEVLREVLDNLGYRYEVILVNDGSSDNTEYILDGIRWPQLQVLSLVSNSGHMAALEAGMRHSHGDFVITMDSDLQHPPELIEKFLAVADTENVDVVYAVRRSRNEESLLKRTTASLYYKLMRTLTDIDIQSSAADFRLTSRDVVNVIKQLPQGNLVFRLLIPSLGFPSSTIEYIAADRFAGKTKYSLKKMFRLLSDSVITFSTKPLLLSVFIGIFSALFSLFGFGYAFITYLSGNATTGWASTISAILLLFGVTFVVLGIHGVYIGSIAESVKRRPRYIIREPANQTPWRKQSENPK